MPNSIKSLCRSQGNFINTVKSAVACGLDLHLLCAC